MASKKLYQADMVIQAISPIRGRDGEAVTEAVVNLLPAPLPATEGEAPNEARNREVQRQRTHPLSIRLPVAKVPQADAMLRITVEAL